MKPRLCSRHTWQLLHHIDWLTVSLYLRYTQIIIAKQTWPVTIFIAEGDGGRGLKKCFLWCSIITVYATFKEKEVAHLVLIIYLVLIVLFRRIHISTHTHTPLSVSSCLLLTWCCVNIWVHVHVNLGLQSFPALALWTLSLTFYVPWVRWDQTFMSVKVCLDWSQLPLFIVCLLIVRVSRQGQVRGN